VFCFEGFADYVLDVKWYVYTLMLPSLPPPPPPPPPPVNNTVLRYRVLPQVAQTSGSVCNH
jgi:hypothetical protein